MINCVVVDDEPIARQGIAEHIKQVDFLHLTASCKDAVEATIWLQKADVHLIFLDIEMPKLTGVQFIRNLQTHPMVVFTTAYPEYAIEGFELDVIDYLLKPISFTRFYKAVVKAQEYYKLISANKFSGNEDFFFIKCNNKIEKIKVADVQYIEGMSNYIIIHTRQKKYVAYLTFKGIEERLPQHMFVRTHKSYLVSLSAIQTIDANELKLENGTLPISKTYREEVLEKISNRLFKR